jgi:hypothetical protein
MLFFPAFIWLRTAKGRSLLVGVGRLLQRPGVVFFLFVPSALIEVALRPFWPGDACNLIADWGNFTHKLSFFVAGEMTGRNFLDCLTKGAIIHWDQIGFDARSPNFIQPQDSFGFFCLLQR